MFKNTAKGFTLIELLIVIAVLGILAVAVLAAINPIEQINRSKDTGSRSDAEQLIGAIDRFYASKGYYPWVTSASITAISQDWDEVDSVWNDGATSVLGKLAASGTEELKASFVSKVTNSEYNQMRVYNEGAQGSSTYICFLPKSNNFESDAGDRCKGSGGSAVPVDYPDEACPGGTGDTAPCPAAKTCWSCLP